MKNKIFIFDVDGTLTYSRRMMHEPFMKWMVNFCKEHESYIVTGSDKKKTFGQIGAELYNTVRKVYQCQGNDVWVGDGLNIKTMTMKIPDDMQELFDHFLDESKFPLRTGRHVDVRPGLINYSIVGRNASIEQRADYKKWDANVGERKLITQMINQACPEYDATVAGETGIDIVRRGLTKVQILSDFTNGSDIVFFGDSCEEGGNDHDIATRVRQIGGTVYHVDGPEETWQLLVDLTKRGVK